MAGKPEQSISHPAPPNHHHTQQHYHQNYQDNNNCHEQQQQHQNLLNNQEFNENSVLVYIPNDNYAYQQLSDNIETTNYQQNIDNQTTTTDDIYDKLNYPCDNNTTIKTIDLNYHQNNNNKINNPSNCNDNNKSLPSNAIILSDIDDKCNSYDNSYEICHFDTNGIEYLDNCANNIQLNDDLLINKNFDCEDNRGCDSVRSDTEGQACYWATLIPEKAGNRLT
ncbi:hypothetical protein HCN44_000088 [Aphidius gifuensis]|uniref:Uncharacterized protein n=1 Tax=Aphidius gifuensis TaxID=684658 RepID=A0A834XN02_APHGI|nr:hypothetical protein HCN44_000088 [Aphidius gifuensis]